jgi:hypothetical protein
MKAMKRKLALSRETLRSLDLREVAGGATFVCGSNSCPMQCGPTEVASCTSCVCSADPGTCA